jgi:hypothetical protein
MAAADIDGIDPGRPLAQQNIGEAAGGSPHIQADQIFGDDGEMFESMRQLDAAARHPGMVSALELERDIAGDT